jgi:hypothetical protein
MDLSISRLSFEIRTLESFFYFCFYCCAGGYIVAFTKVLTMYQMYHTCIRPLHHFLSLHSSNSFNRCHFSYTYTFIQICTIFTLPHPFPTSSPLPLVSSSPGRTCSTLLVLQFCKRKINDIFACLR